MRSKAVALDLWTLTKPGITRLVLVTAAVGFYLGSSGGFDGIPLFHALLGTGLLAAGTNALNQYAERRVDAAMKRTAKRPLPAGRLRAPTALAFSAGISVAGFVYLMALVNTLTAALGAAALLIYIFVYTPLKRRSWLCTLVGAVPGAIPPLMGWTAATGRLDPPAWVLFGIVFLWQMPHFYAIGWMYRQDYARAGFPMLPVLDDEGTRTARQIVLYTLALLAVSLLTTVMGLTGALYLFGALTLGLAFLGLGLVLAAARTGLNARRLFLGSVIYLPILLLLMVADKQI
ncbi:MAG: protoheme IX farnesyltransferase [Gemmatimonadetes bacterium]|uniref:Protoheme IX farnesyltransferase n=1 Tax=Candidatus Kutchimonas denitrificans TaxID=3056748 RepID=A0AAE5CDU6_9BACT|nr:protoheme IX farnesyltransferase [Gemmatimonadota bacterium]NIR76544.1 protoheme IX farnesyltransferase [Candidatus Kutchimonas denitrificans]NIS01545.1 protoheme IX farnesyltransferase [Gemmatimonadota bacterium]NIT67283.1 protoheme IX farnesyltransferase [Gemmatimonadota bacterium]NIU54626.1 protoheme IX farnesyltransferase [Gemmatimonadota bacterium]